jgi:hypothetical protein
VNPSETAFMVLGLIIGAAMGAALWQAIRSKSALRQEVRVTIAPNSVPARRAHTLATPRGSRDLGPLPGSPDGDAHAEDTVASAWSSFRSPVIASPSWKGGGVTVRTPVLNPVPVVPVNAVAVPVVAEGPGHFSATDPKAVLARPAAAAVAVLTRNRAGASSASLTRSPGAVAVLEASSASEGSPVASAARGGGRTGNAASPGHGGAGPSGSSGLEASVMGACADERRQVDERCALADAAREQARRTADALREAQHAYDTLRERVERAQAVADPRRVIDTKTRLHGEFRIANESAAGPEEAEAAARAWLDAINRLNAAVRDAARQVELGGAELRALLPSLDRLGLEAEAARFAAENATDACQAARERLAACEEAATRAAAEVRVPEPEHPFAHVWPVEEPTLTTPPAVPVGIGVSSIIRVLRGDRDARERIVAALAGNDPDAQREWHLRLAHLVDAITARAIDDGYLDVPAGDPFWHMFDAREARDVVGALSALGFRYDGMGGFADGRVPVMRDLSLAVGYAGLDPMRIRTWPREDAMARLYANATVASDAWLVENAGDLSLGRMVDALGTRAASLADTWNAWGRVRPVLLAE